MKRKNYCILNLQYPKEEYEAIKSRLIETGELERFLPAEFSTFAFNESAAMYHYPLNREKALEKGYQWRDEIPFTKRTETVRPEKMPDNIKDVPDNFTKEVLVCEKCGRNYRIVPSELALYRQLSVPLPRRCPFCRMNERYETRNPEKLWQRQCMCDYTVYQNSVKHLHHPEGRCPNEFETSYSPDRPEIVYCEQCYNAEVV